MSEILQNLVFLLQNALWSWWSAALLLLLGFAFAYVTWAGWTRQLEAVQEENRDLKRLLRALDEAGGALVEPAEVSRARRVVRDESTTNLEAAARSILAGEGEARTGIETVSLAGPPRASKSEGAGREGHSPAVISEPVSRPVVVPAAASLENSTIPAARVGIPGLAGAGRTEDDLTRLEGITPDLIPKLREAGLGSFTSIRKLDHRQRNELAKKLGLPGINWTKWNRAWS